MSKQNPFVEESEADVLGSLLEAQDSSVFRVSSDVINLEAQVELNRIEVPA